MQVHNLKHTTNDKMAQFIVRSCKCRPRYALTNCEKGSNRQCVLFVHGYLAIQTIPYPCLAHYLPYPTPYFTIFIPS